MRSRARDRRDFALSCGNAYGLVACELVDLFLLVFNPATVSVGESIAIGVFCDLESVSECFQTSSFTTVLHPGNVTQLKKSKSITPIVTQWNSSKSSLGGLGIPLVHVWVGTSWVGWRSPTCDVNNSL